MQSVDFFKNNLKLLLRIVKEVGTPAFVTDIAILKQKVANIQSAFNKNCLLFYAIKANFNPAIINVLKEAGINGIETISPFEINLAKKLGFDNNQILFTGNNCDADELEQAKNSGVIVNLGSISELNSFAKRFHGTEISIRINPGFGDGEFKQIITGGKDSKFGIYHTQKSVFKSLNSLLTRPTPSSPLKLSHFIYMIFTTFSHAIATETTYTPFVFRYLFQPSPILCATRLLN
jgi:diaminopimelate decarboxylase